MTRIYNNEKFSALTFLSKYRFTVAKYGLPASLVYMAKQSKLIIDIQYINLAMHIVCSSAYNVLAGCPCFATVNLYLLRKVKALNFSLLLLHYYVNSGQLLNYVYIHICLRRRPYRMCALKKGKNSLSHERYSFKYKVFLNMLYTIISSL